MDTQAVIWGFCFVAVVYAVGSYAMLKVVITGKAAFFHRWQDDATHASNEWSKADARHPTIIHRG